MDAENIYYQLKNIALEEYSDIVLSIKVITGPLNVPKNLRIFFIDNSFLDIWFSDIKYSYHWQRIDGTIYRHDNASHKKHKHIKTFPKHFHYEKEENVIESNLDDEPTKAVQAFLNFIREKIKK